jgi:zinc protease
MALRIALYELRQLIAGGLAPADFESTRDYLAKNVFVMTSTQNQLLGYALDSQWYGIPEFTRYVRDNLAKLTREQVNEVIRRHLSGENLMVVAVTEDAKELAGRLTSAEPATIQYDAPKPPEVLEEDARIGALKLGLRPDAVRITPVDEVFAK